MIAEADQQQALFEPEPAVFWQRDVYDAPLSDLPPSDDPVYAGRKVTPKFLASIKTFGVTVPITLVIASGSREFVIADGRQRILAAREAGLETIPARYGRVNSGDMIAVLGIEQNEQRSSNIVSEIIAVERLALSGQTGERIRAMTAISKRRYQQIEQLLRLDPALMDALKTGRIAVGVAESAAKLTKNQQRILANDLAVRGKLTHKDVRAVREVGYRQEMLDLDLDLGDPWSEGYSSSAMTTEAALEALESATDSGKVTLDQARLMERIAKRARRKIDHDA